MPNNTPMPTKLKSYLYIKCIKEHPILYNPDHPEYSNFLKRLETWDIVGEEVMLTGKQLQGKWKNLKDSYVKYLRSIHSKQMTQHMKNYRKFRWAKQMEYFKPYLRLRTRKIPIEDHGLTKKKLKLHSKNKKQKKKGNIVKPPEFIDIHSPFIDDNDDYEDRNDYDYDINVPSSSDVQQSPLQIEIDNCFSLETNNEKIQNQNKQLDNVNIKLEPVSSDELIYECNQNINYDLLKFNTSLSNDFDPTELLFLAYAKTIKKFSLRRQAHIKLKIAQIFMEEEIKDE